MLTHIISKNISKKCFFTRYFSTNKLVLKDIWVVSDGILENERQSIALAKGLDLDYEVHRVVRKKFMWWLPNFIQSMLTGGSSKNKLNSSDKVKFQLPWYLALHPTSKQTSKTISSSYPPKFVISSGLETILTVQDFRKRLPHSTQFVHINYPKIPFKHFDWVVLAKHERLKLAHLGPALSQQKNVIFTQMMLNNIKQDMSQISHSKLQGQVPASWTESNNSKPILGILVSGVHSEFLYLKEYADRFTKDLQTLITKFGVRVILYYNQETPQFIKKSIQKGLQDLIKSNPDYKSNILEYSTTNEDIKNSTANHSLNHIVDLSSHLVVFSGNPVLISESIAAGKPVYLIGANHCRNSLANFVQDLHSKSYVRFFHVSKQYKGVGDPLTYIGQQKPFDKFKLDEVKLAKDELFKLIQEKKELK